MAIITFILILIALILVHEFGHFIVAKKSGIRVDEFGIGFPPKLFGFKKGETEYTFNALPLGGFVKIFGEDPSEEAISGPDSERSFFNKPAYIQAAVLAAGVFFNILFAWFLFSIAFTLGMPSAIDENTRGDIRDVRVIIVESISASPAALSGLGAGDQIVSLKSGSEQITILDIDDISAFIGTREGNSIEVTYKRDGEILMTSVIPKTGIIPGDQAAIGVSLGAVGLVSFPFYQAIFEGALFTFEMLYVITIAIGAFLGGVLTFQADLSQVAGPVGIVSLVGDVSALGFVYLITFTAIISINLAIINLLPFPALDGGRLLFVLIEKIKGSPIKPVIANSLNMIGFALLILLMIVVTYSDIIRLLS